MKRSSEREKGGGGGGEEDTDGREQEEKKRSDREDSRITVVTRIDRSAPDSACARSTQPGPISHLSQLTTDQSPFPLR